MGVRRIGVEETGIERRAVEHCHVLDGMGE